MVATNNGFGFVPSRHLTGGVVRTHQVGSRSQGINGIAAADGTAIYIGAPVKLTTAGVVTAAGATDTFYGIFAGCEYDSSQGNHIVGYWNAPTAATNIVAYVYVDPSIIFDVQADGSLDENAVGATSDGSNLTAGSTYSGQSQATLSTTVGTSTHRFLIIGITDRPDNASGDAYTVMQVKINVSQVGQGAGYAGI